MKFYEKMIKVMHGKRSAALAALAACQDEKADGFDEELKNYRTMKESADKR